MNNKSLIRIASAVVAVIWLIFIIRFVIGGDEDDWICTEKGWVKHGNPNDPMPTIECSK